MTTPDISVADDGTVLVDGTPFDPAVHDIGWQVLDPDGNVVASGPIVIAEMTGELIETLDLHEGE